MSDTAANRRLELPSAKLRRLEAEARAKLCGNAKSNAQTQHDYERRGEEMLRTKPDKTA